VSGAGRAAKESTLYCEIAEGINSYRCEWRHRRLVLSKAGTKVIDLGLARTMCIWFSRKITKSPYTVIYGVFVRFWPTLVRSLASIHVEAHCLQLQSRIILPAILPSRFALPAIVYVGLHRLHPFNPTCILCAVQHLQAMAQPSYIQTVQFLTSTHVQSHHLCRACSVGKHDIIHKRTHAHTHTAHTHTIVTDA
jgi:hypothetical protein